MRISELLQSIAGWLESPNNEALLLAEDNEECSKIVAENCVLAAKLLKNAAEEVDLIEPFDSKLTPESLEELAGIANAFDASGDERLKKQAAVIDELLLTIAAPEGGMEQFKKLQESRIEELKKKYKNPSEKLNKEIKAADTESAIEKSNLTKKYKVLEAPLSTRYCPDHAGVQVSRVGEHTWQCELDKKIYNFETGFKLNDGTIVPGADVSEQTTGMENPITSIFDSRVGRLQSNRA